MISSDSKLGAHRTVTKIVAYLLIVLASACVAGEPGPNYKLVNRNKPDSELEFFGGPHIDIVTELYRCMDGDTPAFKIVLSSLVHPSRKELLFAYDRIAEAELSPDGKWFIVNDRPGRGECEPRLFRQQKDLKFTEVKGAQIWEKAIRFFISSNKYPPSIGKHLLHSEAIVESMLWSDDSRSLLLRIRMGRTGEPLWVYNWRCIYDVTSGRISTDLQVLNRGAILPGKHLTTDQ